MKNLSRFFVILIVVTINVSAQTIRTETTFQSDNNSGGISVQRIQLNSNIINLKYDYKVDVVNKSKTVNDVMSISGNFKTDEFTISPCIIKLGDFKKTDEYLLDLTVEKKWANIAATFEVGRGMRSSSEPRDYMISRISHQLFTVEGGVLSKYGYTSFSELTDNKYAWIAYHPKYAFMALGSEISRTWILAGTKDLKNFGNLTFANFDRANNNFWFRSQFGLGSVNQKFFCLDNYRVASSYLIVPPFFYTHFSPLSTKGDYGFKIDGKRVVNTEKWEASVSRQFGQIGQLAVGWTREQSKNGFVIEYYNSASISNMFFSIELKYDSIKKITGFVTANYEF